MTLHDMIRKASGSALGLICAAGVAFLSTVVLSRSLPPAVFGSVVLALTWAVILSQFAQLGFLRASVKLVATLRADQDLAALKSYLLFSVLAVTSAAIIGGLGALIAVSVFGDPDGFFAQLAWMIALLLLPLSLARLASGILLGEQRNFLGAFFQSGLPFLGILLATAYLYLFGPDASAMSYVTCTVVGAYVATGIGLAVVAHVTKDAWRATRTGFQTVPWISLALPLMMVGAVQIMNKQIGVIVLGAIASPDQVAAYYPAFRISEFAAFGLMAVNSALASSMAVAYAQKNAVFLQSLLTKAAILSLVSTTIIAVFFVLFDGFFLGLFAGVAREGRAALQILLVGQVLNAMAGSTAVFMAMAGQERFAALLAIGVLACNVALHLILVPPFGIEGAAIATSLAMGIWNAALLTRCRRTLGVNPSVFTRGVMRR